jgi:hypothetical protein
MNKDINIAGVPVKLNPIGREQLKGLSLDYILSFRFYKTVFNQYDLCIAEPNDTTRTYTPRQYRRIAVLLERIVKMPVAFLLFSIPSNLRSRLIEQGVYFIQSDKYAFLPGLLINEKTKRKKDPELTFSPVAQYILLYYLLNRKIDEFSIQEIQPKTPYNYLAVSRAINELEDKDLFQVYKDWKTKLISSSITREELWEKSQPFFSSPVKKTVYAERLLRNPFYISGISALSHYSFLNPDEQETVAIWEKDFNPGNNQYSDWDDFDFKYKIEIWKYSPTMGSWQDEYVDKLSLYLSLKDDNDPRVENELETLINKIWQ